MAGTVEKKLAELGISLPEPESPGRQLRSLRSHWKFHAGVRTDL